MNIKNYVNDLKISIFGLILYTLFSTRRKIVLTNINLVFGSSLSPSEQTKLAKAFFSHLGELIKELYWHHTNKKSFTPLIEIRGLEHVQKANQHGRGIIFLGSHTGNWELALLNTLSAHEDFKLHIIRKKQKKRLQAFLASNYQRVGLHIIYPQGAIREIIKKLKTNQHIVFTFDQHTDVSQGAGITAMFFNNTVGCNRTLPVLAKKTRACILPVNNFRLGPNHHVVEILPELPWLKAETEEDELKQNIQQYNHVLEQFILRHPEQWWWLHRRWKINSELYK